MEQITRAECDVQIQTAKNNPRKLTEFYRRAEAMVTMDQETAESCLYRLTRKDKRTGKISVIEGESIRMGEIVASCYGNLRSAVQIAGYTPTRVNVRAVCHDLETNNLIAVEKQAKTAYSDGTPYNEDLAVMTANATVSKALRDAIFRVVPRALIKPLREKARLVAFGDAEGNKAVPFKSRVTKAMVWAQSLGIDLSRVYAVLGVKGEEDIGIDHLETLTGLKTAIKDGEQTPEEAFPPLESESKPVLIHPEKAKQQEQAKAKTETKPAKEETKPVVTETKASVAETKQFQTETAKPPVITATGQPITPAEVAAKTEDEKAESAMGLAPEKQKSEAPKPEPAPETPAAAPGSLTEAQAAIKAAIEGAGYTFEDLASWAAGKFFPVKTSPQFPKDWGMINPDKAVFLAKSIRGIIAAIKDIKDKKDSKKGSK